MKFWLLKEFVGVCGECKVLLKAVGLGCMSCGILALRFSLGL